MKSLLLIPAVLLSLGLASCDVTTSDPPPVTPTQVTDVITEVQAGVKTGCSIAVQTQSVANILSAIGVPYVGMVSDIVAQVCGAFNKAGATRRGGAVSPVVLIKGHAIKLRGHRI